MAAAERMSRGAQSGKPCGRAGVKDILRMLFQKWAGGLLGKVESWATTGPPSPKSSHSLSGLSLSGTQCPPAPTSLSQVLTLGPVPPQSPRYGRCKRGLSFPPGASSMGAESGLGHFSPPQSLRDWLGVILLPGSAQ